MHPHTRRPWIEYIDTLTLPEHVRITMRNLVNQMDNALETTLDAIELTYRREWLERHRHADE